MAVTEKSTLKATLGGDGLVYHSEDSDKGACSELDPFDFLRWHRGRRLRILSSQANAAFIAVAYRHACEFDIMLEIGRPDVCDWAAAQQAGPGGVLRAMRAIGHQVPSCGGWHPMQPAEYPSYAMAAELAAPAGSREKLLELLLQHPAWPALGFVAGLDRVKACELLALILDPRLYVDRAKPGSDARLRCYLGLVRDARRASSGRALRQNLVRQAWQTLPPPADMTPPGCWLWRFWAACDRPKPERDLKASRKFLSYLRQVWLDGLRGTTWCPDRLFVPEYYFADSLDAAAWRRFITSNDAACPAAS